MSRSILCLLIHDARVEAALGVTDRILTSDCFEKCFGMFERVNFPMPSVFPSGDEEALNAYGEAPADDAEELMVHDELPLASSRPQRQPKIYMRSARTMQQHG